MELDGELGDIDDSLQQLRSLTHALEAALQRKNVSSQNTCHDVKPRSANSSAAQSCDAPADGSSSPTRHSCQSAVHNMPADSKPYLATTSCDAEQADIDGPQLSHEPDMHVAAPSTTASAVRGAGSYHTAADAGDPGHRPQAAEIASNNLPDAEEGSQLPLQCNFAAEVVVTSTAESPTLGSLCSSSSPLDAIPSQQSGRQLAPRAAPVPTWKQQVQQEQKLERAQLQQHAQHAAQAAQQLRASQQEAAWKAAQQHSPFKSTGSSIAGAKRTLKASLSGMLRDAAAATQAVVPAQEPATAAEQIVALSSSTDAGLEQSNDETDTTSVCVSLEAYASDRPRKKVVPLLDRFVQDAAAHKRQQQQEQVTQNPASLTCDTEVSRMHHRKLTAADVRCEVAGTDTAALSLTSAQHSSRRAKGRVTPTNMLTAGSSSTRHSSAAISLASHLRVQDWAAADAETDAEVAVYLRDHWQQQYLPAAALILQCAWRNRGPRLIFNRYIDMRHRNVTATLSPAFTRWQHWTVAGSFYRRKAVQQAFTAWRELLLLQLQFCRKVVLGLQRGALSGNTVNLLSWRMCTPVDTDHSIGVRPSFGGLLGNLLKQRLPRLRHQAYFKSWLIYCRRLQARRTAAHKLLSAAASRWQAESLGSCLGFWHMYTVAAVCERLHIALPVFKLRSHAFESWLWRHERGKQMRQQAMAMFKSNCLQRCFGDWRAHVNRIHCMRAAWSNVVLLTPEDLVISSMNAFKVNWKEQVLHRRLLALCFSSWLKATRKNISVAIMRRRVLQAADYNAKRTAVTAFKRYADMSRVVTTAGTIKLWQARPLALAHLHAWMNDSLHMTVYLLWWRWKRRAVGRVRLRAAIGLHMYRNHWLAVELVLTAWRKVTAIAKAAKTKVAQVTPAQAAAALADSASPASPVVLACSTTPPTAPNADGEQQQVNQDMEESQAASEDTAADDLVFVSLADFPAALPWRPLASRAEVVAQKGLQHLSGARLARTVRDLRELEGKYIVKDHDRGAEGLLGDMMYNKRRPVSSGLKAIVASQLPMTLLWQAMNPGDSYWWQRVVGLVQQHVPHPDSWKCFISRYDARMTQHYSSGTNGDTSCSSSANSCCTGVKVPDDDELSLHEFLHGDCSRVRLANSTSVSGVMPGVLATNAQGQHRTTSVVGSSRLSAVSAPNAPHLRPPALSVVTDNVNRSSLEHGYQLGASTPAAAVPASGNHAASGGAGAAAGKAGLQDGPAAAAGGLANWPAEWDAEDIAWLCQMVQAEELLETAVFMLLGIGCDSGQQLYETLGRLTAEQGLDMQGDMLAWLLSTALAHDSAHSHKVLLKARARDNLIVATMELRQRAIALHLHFPWKFTLSSRGPVADVYAVWKKVINKVEAERDWGASSSDDEDTDGGSNSTDASIALLLQQLQSKQTAISLEPPTDVAQHRHWQQQQGVQDSVWPAAQRLSPQRDALSVVTNETCDPQTVVDSAEALLLPHAATARPRSPAAVALPANNPALHEAAVGNTTAMVTAVLAAAGTAGTNLQGKAGTPSLPPGSMLDQFLDITEQLYHLSQSTTPEPPHAAYNHITHPQRQSGDKSLFGSAIPSRQQQFRAHHHAGNDEDSKQHHRQQQQAALAATVGLFGPTPQAAVSATLAAPMHGSHGLDRAAAAAVEMELGQVFTVPVFASLSGGRGSPSTSHSPSAAAAAGRSARARSHSLTLEHPALNLEADEGSEIGSYSAGGAARPQSCCGSYSYVQLKQFGSSTLERKLSAPVGLQSLQSSRLSPRRLSISTGLTLSANQLTGTHVRSSSSSMSSSAGGSSKRSSSSGGGGGAPGSAGLSSKPGSRLRNRNEDVISSEATGSDTTSHQQAATECCVGAGAGAGAAGGGADGDIDGDAVVAELQHVLQSVLAPVDGAAAAAQEAAAGLAEACTSWLIDLQQQRQQQQVAASRPVDAVLQGQQLEGVDSDHDAAECVSETAAAVSNRREAVGPAARVSSPTGGYTGGCTSQSPTVSPQSRQLSAVPKQQNAYATAALSAAVAAGFSSGSCATKSTASTTAPAARTAGAELVGHASNGLPQGGAEDMFVKGVTSVSSNRGLQDGEVQGYHKAAGSVAVSVPGLSSSPAHKLKRESEQQQQQQQREVSRSSSSSSLPSIPSCSSLLQQISIPAAATHGYRGQKEDVQLPAIINKHQQQQQQQQSEKPKSAGAASTAAANEAMKAVWLVDKASPALSSTREHTETAAAVDDTDVVGSGTQASVGEPALQQLLQDAVQEGWQQFELVAQQLAARLAAAMQTRHAAHKAAVTAGQATQQQQQQQKQATPHTSAAAVESADLWCWQPDAPDAAVSAGLAPADTAGAAGALTAAAAASVAAAAGHGGGDQSGMQVAAAAAVQHSLATAHHLDAAADDLSDVLCQLMAGPLAARFAFWKGIVKQQQTGSHPATDIYKLAWKGLLHNPNGLAVTHSSISSHHQASLLQQQQLSLAAAVLTSGSSDPRAAHLKAKLQQYLVAYTEWRCQLAAAPPLAAHERWLTLEHEEQVLDFITGLTISVYQSLLNKHSTGRSKRLYRHGIADGASTATAAANKKQTATAAGGHAAGGSPAVGHRGLTAKGHAVVAATKVCMTKPKPVVQQRKAVPVFVIPGPPVTSSVAAARVSGDMVNSTEPVQQQQQQQVYISSEQQRKVEHKEGGNALSPSRCSVATAQRLGSVTDRGLGRDDGGVVSRASSVSSWND